MSKFFSLDDDDDDDPRQSFPAPAGPSRVAGEGTGRAATSRSAANPISAMLNDDDTEQSQARNRNNGMSSRINDGRDREETASVIQDYDTSGNYPMTKREMAPIDELRRAWTNERAAPELLSWRGEAVDGVCSQVEEQLGIVDSLSADAATAEEEHIRLSLVELDVERARWLLRSYLRCRLEKIEKHAPYIARNRESRDRLSELERGYAARYVQLCTQHFNASVLDFLPENMRGLDDRGPLNHPDGRGDMIIRPELDAPVFVRCLIDCGAFRFPGVDDIVYFTKGTIHLVRYNSVRRLVADDMVELL